MLARIDVLAWSSNDTDSETYWTTKRHAVFIKAKKYCSQNKEVIYLLIHHFFFVHSKVERNNSFFKNTLFLSTRWLQQIYNWNLFFFSHQEDMENADEKNGDPPMLFVLSIFFTSILHLISSFLLCFLVLSLKFLTRQVSRLITLTRERGFSCHNDRMRSIEGSPA